MKLKARANYLKPGEVLDPNLHPCILTPRDIGKKIDPLKTYWLEVGHNCNHSFKTSILSNLVLCISTALVPSESPPLYRNISKLHIVNKIIEAIYVPCVSI